MSTAHDLPVPPRDAAEALPALRLVPAVPLDFDAAVRSIRPRLHRYAIRRLGDVHEAEELVQEALLRAYSHREQLLTEDDLAAWTTVVTGRLVIDRLRVRGRSTSVADVPEGNRVSRDTAEVVVARDEARVALDALDAMPPRQASLLWAREVEGQSYEDLCQRFAMTEPAVRSVLTRARKALRKEYALRGGTLPAGGLAILAPWLAGMTWAEKLRRAASRIAAPAALGTAGIATLGGLVLSPYGVLPSHKAPTVPFTPSHAVVLDYDAAPKTTAAQSHAVAPTGFGSSGSGLAGTLQDVTERVANPCINDSDSGGDGVFVDPGVGLPRNASAGTRSCDKNESARPRNQVVLTPTLPENPTGMTTLGVASDKVDCSTLPTSPLYTCSPEPSAAGAQP